METRLSSSTKEVIIGPNQPTILIGERINPTGKKKLADDLTEGRMDVVREEAMAQVRSGADIIDVNVGMFGVDEVSLLPKAVETVMEAVDVPLCLDSARPEVLEAALKVYKGKALINSVSGEEKSLSSVLPLAKEYGAAVIGLLQDDEGIPKDSEKRITVAHKIIERAGAVGISCEDIIIDCLAFAVGADTNSGPALIEAIGRVKAKLGVNMTLGVSNVSFGLPDRGALNKALIPIVIAAGATSLIVDVGKVRSTVLATDLILGRDRYARRYIGASRQS
jgi:5-methyltetrahydrofolate--homocysteine methyltransferase